MTEWLSTLLPDSCPANAELAIARFATREAIGRNGFSLSSPAFPQGGELDPCFTADEEDAVAPPMEWTAPPKMAEELVPTILCLARIAPEMDAEQAAATTPEVVNV